MVYDLRAELAEAEAIEELSKDRTFRAFPCLPPDARLDRVLLVLPATRWLPSLTAVRGDRGVWFIGTTVRSPGAPFLVAFASDEKLSVARENQRSH